MPVIRNTVARVTAGGPHQYAELRNMMMVRVSDFGMVNGVVSELDKVGLSTSALENVPVLLVEPAGKIEDTLARIENRAAPGSKINQAVSDIQKARASGKNSMSATIPSIAATNALKAAVESIPGVGRVDFVESLADFGPQNLRVDVASQESVSKSNAQSKKYNLDDIIKALGVEKAWNKTRGENAVCAIFDTGFSEDLFDKSRIIDTFHGADTKSVWAPSEGHGTMTSGAALANKDNGVPFNGVAPDADIILIRVTDSNDQIRSDVISKGWDWLLNLNVNKPIVTNHSYGTPLCSGRPKEKYCDSVQNDIITMANSQAGITSVYAAGNEARQCGHRPSGLTNAVTGTNSLESLIAVGAMMSNGREIQIYSSHGRGDCSPIADPKPNVSVRIPKYVYWGMKDGYGVKNESYGLLGSTAGTSHASPLIAGMVTLMQSEAVRKYNEGTQSSSSRADTRGSKGQMQTEEIKYILEKASKPPHINQVNQIGFGLTKKGYDARFGHGEPDINKALEMI